MEQMSSQVLLKQLTAELIKQSKDGRLCVAFSGGVDSALLVKLACSAGIDVYAVTFDSTLQPLGEADWAAKQATTYGARHQVLWVDPLEDAAVKNNSRERCYRCKYALFAALKEYSEKHGMIQVIDGTNADDMLEFRPGLRALQELEIHSPLAHLGIEKLKVREMAEIIGLDVAKRPSSPCLATRFPYDTQLTPETLARAGMAEMFLHEQGFETVRVRVHGDLARIEVPLEKVAQLMAMSDKIDHMIRSLGFAYVTIDLSGYRSGRFDEVHGV